MAYQFLSVEQSYRAMFYFLEREYELTQSDELAGLLGSLSWQIWQTGHGPADPDAWQEWLNAVEKAKNTDDNAEPAAQASQAQHD